MTIDEMKTRKAELGYTNETIAKLSGVPLGTVQKIFAGETKSPRYDTVQKLVKLLERDAQPYEYVPDTSASQVGEAEGMYVASYDPRVKQKRTSVDSWPERRKKVIGIADGKYRMPHDSMFFDDEISDLFSEL